MDLFNRSIELRHPDDEVVVSTPKLLTREVLPALTAGSVYVFRHPTTAGCASPAFT